MVQDSEYMKWEQIDFCAKVLPEKYTLNKSNHISGAEYSVFLSCRLQL